MQRLTTIDYQGLFEPTLRIGVVPDVTFMSLRQRLETDQGIQFQNRYSLRSPAPLALLGLLTPPSMASLVGPKFFNRTPFPEIP